MNSVWQEYLSAQGAQIHNGTVTDFGNPAAELSAIDAEIIADLSHFSLICAEGEEARDFLHNQFTNDVQHLGSDQSQLNNYCTPKGRILASFRLFADKSTIYLRVHHTTAEVFSRRLSMFIMRSKVTLSDKSDALVRFGIAGPNAANRLQAALGTAPAEVDQVIEVDGVNVIHLPGSPQRFELHGPVESMTGLWSKLAEGASMVGERVWSLTDIRTGIPTVTDATVELFVPQMLNMQLIGGLSFKKGCYPGQEIVARMQYLGQLKRRMQRYHVSCDHQPEAGDSLFSPDSTSGQGAGKIVDVAPAPEGGYEMLCVVEISSAEGAGLHLLSATGAKLEPLGLPYSFN